jgi:hypothetical protein
MNATDDTIHDSGNLPAVRDGHTGELAAIPPEADAAWYAEITAGDPAVPLSPDGHPAITLPPQPEPPPLTDEERARLYLWERWAAAYLGPHHQPDWTDPFWSQRFDQYLRTFTAILIHEDAGAPAGDKQATARAAVMLTAQPGAPEAEQVIGVRLAQDRLYGKQVTCKTCHHTFTYSDIEPYYNGGRGRRTGGQCYACILGPGAAQAADGRDVMTIYGRLAAERGT